jgi:hypothetical protein
MFMSDRILLLHFVGDEKEWLVYMTIGNLSLTICQMFSMHCVVIVAVLPIPIKNHHIPQTLLDEERQPNREVLNEALQHSVQPLTFRQYPSAESG